MSAHTGRLVARLLLGAAMLASVPDGAAGQDQSAAPPPASPAVYGGARRQQPGVNNVSISANVFGGYDTNILSSGDGLGGAGGFGSTDQTDSTFAGTSASLQWSQSRDRVQYFGSVGGQYRSFFDVDDFDTTAYSASGGLSTQLSRRSTLGVYGNVGVQPFYQFGVLGGLGRVPIEGTVGTGPVFTPDFQAAREQVVRYGTGADYTYRLSARTSFSASADRSGFRPLNDEAQDAGLRNLGGTSARATLTRRLTEHLSARAGYGYTQFDRLRRGQVSTDPEAPAEQQSFGIHNIDVGLNYNRAFQFARRTSFSFGTGTNVTRRSDLDGVSDRRGTQFVVTGFATLQREFLRTWAASMNYNRGMSYVEGFNDVVVFDAVTASIGGLFTDRLDGSAAVTYTGGALGAGSGERISTLGGGGQLRFAFTSNLAAFASYTYARFGIPDSRLPQNLAGPYRPERQGVRVGLSVWFDLLR